MVPKFLWCCHEVKPCVAVLVHAYIVSSKKMHDSSRQMLCSFANKSTTARHLYLACGEAAIANEPPTLLILHEAFYCIAVIINKFIVRNVDVMSCKFNVVEIYVNQNYMYKRRCY